MKKERKKKGRKKERLGGRRKKTRETREEKQQIKLPRLASRYRKNLVQTALLSSPLFYLPSCINIRSNGAPNKIYSAQTVANGRARMFTRSQRALLKTSRRFFYSPKNILALACTWRSPHRAIARYEIY